MTTYFTGFYPHETSAGSKGSAAFLSAYNTATVYLYKRSTVDPAGPNADSVYTFATATLDTSSITNGWSSTIPIGVDPLYIVLATAYSDSALDTILVADWSTPKILAQNGGPGDPGTPAITGYLTNEAVTLFAYASGVVVSYTPATGNFKVYSGTTDVSSNFSLSTVANPQSLTVSYASQTYAVTGGLDMNEDTATLTIRATGSGAYTGVLIDKVFTIAKAKGGYEIVAALPTTENFIGRMVFNEADQKLYRYTSTGFTAAVPATDVTGTIDYQQIGNGAVRVQHLLVTPNALNIDSQFRDNNLWFQVDELDSGDGYLGSTTVGWYVEENAVLVSANEAAIGNRFITLFSGRPGQNNVNNRFLLYADYVNNNKIPLSPGVVYELKAGCHNNSNQTMYASIEYYDASWAFKGSDGLDWGAGAIGVKSMQFTPPTGAVWGRLLFFNNSAGTTYSGWARFGNILVREASGATAIVDGSLVASKLAANSVTADKIEAGAVTAAKVATSNLITLSAQINDGLITTAKIGDAQITTAKIGDLQVDNAKIQNLTIGTQKVEDLSMTRSSSIKLDFAGFSYPTDRVWFDLQVYVSDQYLYVGASLGDYVYDPETASYVYVGTGLGDYQYIAGSNVVLQTSVTAAATTASANQIVDVDCIITIERDGGSDDNVGLRVIRTNDSKILGTYNALRARSGKSTYSLFFKDADPLPGVINTYKVQGYNNTDNSHYYECSVRAVLYRK